MKGKMETQQASQIRQLVTFRLGKELFGVNINNVKEIIRFQQITSVPMAPDYLSGLTNLRGTVIPVIKTALKMGIQNGKITQDTRILILEREKGNLGIIVDRVEGVEKPQVSSIKAPPEAIFKDIDARFIKNIIEMEDGKIILELNIDSITEIELSAANHSNTVSEIESSLEINEEKEVEKIKERQLVTFILEGEEYGLPIESVREVLRFKEATEVPGSPEYVLGLLSIRDMILPIVDLKRLLEIENLSHHREPLFQSEDQRIIVVDIENILIGVVVDKIQQVLRVGEDKIEPPSGIFKKNEDDPLCGIVKLNQGDRLIMLLDGKRLIPEQKLKGIRGMVDESKEYLNKEETEGEEIQMDEIQLVTFRLGKEEYGIPINDVQEINRLTTITEVPKAPDFIDGVMNLRGNVIPVINLRKRFGLEDTEKDESTRVIIVNLEDRLTGLIVDSVSEVLRLAKSSIQRPPRIIKEDVNIQFIDSIGKIDDQRMIFILDIEKILDIKERGELREFSERDMHNKE